MIKSELGDNINEETTNKYPCLMMHEDKDINQFTGIVVWSECKDHKLGDYDIGDYDTFGIG